MTVINYIGYGFTNTSSIIRIILINISSIQINISYIHDG